MSRPLLRLLLAAGLLGLLPATAPAGISQYTDHGRIDFDTAVQFLNAYGTWKKTTDGLWAFTPLDHQTPYTHGRWLYTDYGWYWAGTSPHSWVTEHYGYWKRGDDKVWSWYPGPDWLPNIVEIRATPTHLGWRSAPVDENGTFTEDSIFRYQKTDEWTFVTRAAFAGPITPAVIAPPAQAAQLLDDTTDSFHSYFTYRPITRPGPHPADFIGKGDGGMFAPFVYAGESVPPVPLTPAAGSIPAQPAPAKTNSGVSAPSGLATGVPASTPPAVAASVSPGDTADNSPPADSRQVHYWTIMCLPNAWATAPPDAKPSGVYVFRPDIYQDQEGIERRIGLWLDPSTRKTMKLRLTDVLSARPAKPAGAASASGPASPAVPVASEKNAFRSEFDQDYHSTPEVRKNSSSSKPAPSGNAPDGSATAP